jgi:hypothetical protein
MSGDVTLCATCGGELRPDDEVVRAAEQVEAGSRDGVRQYLEGIASLFHVRHYPGDGLRWREKDRGRLSDVSGVR